MVGTNKNEKRAKRRGLSRAISHVLPTLARGAGVGVFVLGAMLACDNPVEPDAGETGYIYVASYLETLPGIQKYYAKTALLKSSFTPVDLCIAADVDHATGDVFSYSWNFLKRYTAEGRLKYEVPARTQRYSGREYIDLNEKKGIIYFLNGRGQLYRFRAEDGEDLGILYGTNLSDAEQLLVDNDENRIWIVGKSGGEIHKYSLQSGRVLLLKDGPYTRIAVEPNSNTMIAGVIKTGGYYLYRYTKTGVKNKEFRAGIEPRRIGVEPGSGVIWVSDGLVIERYAPDGAKLDGIPKAGFEFIDFGPDGRAVFILDAAGYFAAYNTGDLKNVWRARRFPPPNDIHFVKYNEK